MVRIISAIKVHLIQVNIIQLQVAGELARGIILNINNKLTKKKELISMIKL